MAQKLKIKKGDMVRVIAGDDKGTEGEVKLVYPEKQRVLVDGVNMIHRHTKPNADNPEGGIIKKEAPIHVSNVMIIDPGSGETSRVGRAEGDDGKLVRIAKKSGGVLK